MTWDAYWLAMYMRGLADFERTPLGAYFERLVEMQRSRMLT